MATVTVRFKLSDFGWRPLAGLHPRVKFVPTQTAVQGGRLMPDKPVYAVLAESGDAEIVVTTTDDVLPTGVGYHIRIDWLLNRNDPEPKYWAEYPGIVHLVPGVTDLGQIIGRETRNDWVYVADDAVRSDEWAGFQLNPVTGNLYQRVG